MITLLLLVLTALLGIVAYRLTTIDRAVRELNSRRSTISVSLNPLFSEEEIAAARDLHEKWQKRVDRSFEALQRTEKQEIEAHHRSRRAKTDFVPSPRLKDIIQDLTISLCGRDVTQTKVQKMIESNIAVLRGAKLVDVSAAFDADEQLRKWDNAGASCTDEKFIAAVHGEQVRKDYDDGLSERKQLWQDNWDAFLKAA